MEKVNSSRWSEPGTNQRSLIKTNVCFVLELRWSEMSFLADVHVKHLHRFLSLMLVYPPFHHPIIIHLHKSESVSIQHTLLNSNFFFYSVMDVFCPTGSSVVKCHTWMKSTMSWCFCLAVATSSSVMASRSACWVMRASRSRTEDSRQYRLMNFSL